MKKVCFLFFVIILQFISAQIKDPVKLNFEVKNLGENLYEAVITANLEPKWHIYSKDLPPDSGIPTEMLFTSKNDVELIGKVVEEGKKHDEFSQAFGVRIVYYSNFVKFKQKFKLKNPEKGANIKLEFTYQTCDDRVCLAPNTLEFSKKIEAKAIASSSENSTTIIPEKINGKDSITRDVNTKQITNEEATEIGLEKKLNSKELKVSTIEHDKPLTDCGSKKEKHDENFLNYLLLGFIGGFIALLTPCVFPMIPLTVSYFTKGNKNSSKGKRDAFLYGFFIFLIFVLLSLPFHIIDGIAGNIFNEISTSIWLNITFFIVFIFFAGSFFGYYEITLPSWVTNRSSKAEETGGFIGIFFMALTLVLVSFSCTGPILGSLLGSAVTGSANVPLLLTYTLAGFGLSWAFVFGLLALFPQLLQSLPKSGGWMNTLKVVLGFIELGLALKFLSKADLVSKTFLLKRELFIFIWILITIGLVLYLFGKIRFRYDDKSPKLSLGRKLSGVLGIGFVLYLIQGFFPSERPKLQLLSGILPPINVSYFYNEKEGILGMHLEHDYFKALEIAKKENKPILIDFTGYGCENCRKMEEFVWSEPDILPILQNEVVLASLYVDDKETLPENEQTKIDMGGGKFKKIKTIGDKWSLFQQLNFKNNSQPHYVLLTPDGKVINSPVSGYMPKEDFKKFLDCGISYHKSIK